MKPESRLSSLQRSFRRSFRRKKNDDKDKAAQSSVSKIEEEEKAFAEFRKVINDIIQPRHDDIALHRFLKGQDFDVKAAEKMYKLDISFRKLLEIEDVNNIPMPEAVKTTNKTVLLGFDKDGCLIRMIRIGKVDLKGLVHCASTFRIISLLVRTIETDLKYVEDENKKSGKVANQITYILDFDGLTTSQVLHKPVLDTLILCIKKLQDHYFGIWKKIFLINTPTYFPSVYKLFKPILVEGLSSKIMVCNTVVLLEDIDPDVLPDFLSGSKTDYLDDPKYAGLITEYAPIPRSFYAKAEEFLDPNDPGVESVTVSPGGFVNIPIPVIVANSYINYHICSKDNDINITVYYEPNVTVCHIEKYKKKVNPEDILSKLEQLTPELRIQCHVKPEVGRAKAWRSGVYTLNLDNTYSWMNSKQIYYKIKVIPPESNKPDIIKKVKELEVK